ncbi:hypothetical protein [Mycobacterium sp. 23]|uniref:hypothetical protein n=1 Tax=Mycobacterium sp. 23 TaxID=3400424 RepID=UPI003AAC2FE5
MTNIHFAAALFPQHAKSGADALLTAADNAAAQTQRLQRFRTQVADLLGIPANAEDAFVLNEIEHMCRRAEECEHDHRGVPRG